MSTTMQIKIILYYFSIGKIVVSYTKVKKNYLEAIYVYI